MEDVTRGSKRNAKPGTVRYTDTGTPDHNVTATVILATVIR
jgi:hypothetical protein